MITIAQINIAPVKSMALVSLDEAALDLGGIRDDRRFYLVNARGRLLTRRQVGKLAQLVAAWDAAAGRLTIRFPDGVTLSGAPELGPPVWSIIWGRRVRGRPLQGDWSPAISDFCGQPATLMMSDLPGQAYDEFPISVLSRASVARLSSEMGLPAARNGDGDGNSDGDGDDNSNTAGDRCLTSDRFRPTLLLAGCEPHQEDAWLTRPVSVGDAVIRILAPDPRCAIINQRPDTGETDADAVKSILNYRPNPLAAYFGVYGIVEKPGPIRLGDAVKML